MFETWKLRDGDRVHGAGAFQFERLFVRVTRWRVVLAGVGAAAYLAGLVLYLPAEAVVPGDRDAVGTAWRGQAALAPAFALGWTARPFSSLAAFAPVGDFTLTGPATSVAGTAVWHDGGVVVRRADGVASLRLLSTLLPELPLSCEGEATLSASDLALSGGWDGRATLHTGGVLCAAAGQAAAVGPLSVTATSDAEGFGAAARDATGLELLSVRRGREGGVALTVTPEGAATLPGLSATTVDVR